MPTPPAALPRPEDTGVYSIDTKPNDEPFDLEAALERLGRHMLRGADKLGLDV